jgi:cytochrome d ubiquinol oxidase subunit I
MFDALDLARFQFAFVVSFHIIFPAFTIGLASYLAVLEGLWLWKNDEKYLQLFNYWIKIFAIAFAMGVVSGIVMSYQFGTNWSVFSDKTGPILGPLMGYEVLSAFFLEAGFLGIMLFGLNKVGKRLHFFATLMVAFGTFFSAFWILSVNSWMHTPAGFGMNEFGQFIPEDWMAIIFNPSFPYRLVHMLMAAYLTTAFVVGGVGAYHLLKNNLNPCARTMLSMALWMATIVAPLQMIAGDLHGLNTLKYQPAKIAAMEGHYETQRGAPLILFGLPDDDKAETKYRIEIPKLGSLILTHDMNGEVKGLKEWPKAERPPAEIIFWTFRIMVGIGMLMIAIGLYSLWLRYKNQLYNSSIFHRALMIVSPIGFVAVICGWITTEVGRQPYTVYGLLTTAQSVSPIDAPAVSASLFAFIVTYFVVFGAGVFYLFKQFNLTPGMTDKKELGVKQNGVWGVVMTFFNRRKFTQ